MKPLLLKSAVSILLVVDLSVPLKSFCIWCLASRVSELREIGLRCLRCSGGSEHPQIFLSEDHDQDYGTSSATLSKDFISSEAAQRRSTSGHSLQYLVLPDRMPSLARAPLMVPSINVFTCL